MTEYEQRSRHVDKQFNIAGDAHIGQIGDRYGLTVEEVAALVITLKREDQPVVWDGRLPYLGLDSFRESDAEFFFGREKLVVELLERVKRAPFVVLSGPSGSGKSSVARAGLFHALRQGRLERSREWLQAAMRPMGDPLENLAAAIDRTAARPGAGDHVRQQGSENPAALSEAAAVLLSDDPRQRFVLLVDQFEEIFTQTRDEAVRQAFINLLTAAAGDGRLIIVLALRSDFISNCARYPELREMLSKEFQLVGAMEPNDLAKAITLPALEVGAEIDPALVSRIMADMKGEPGALPLMSFALRDLFEAEKPVKGQVMDMTLPEYLARGGIESALERHANAVFDTFTAEQQELARGIFSRLVEIGQGRVDTRRTVAFEELVPAGADPALVAATVAELAEQNARLITTGGAGDQPGAAGMVAATVTIAHEKLIDAWPWLRRLIDENRDSIKLQNDIAEQARAWENHNRDNSYLFGGARLAATEEQLATGMLQLSGASATFVAASAARRRIAARNRRLVMAGLAALAVVAGLAALLAINYAGQADIERRNAVAESDLRATSEAEAIANADLAATRQAEAEFQTSLVQSQALAAAADAAAVGGDQVLAAQLGLEARRAAETGPAYAALQRHLPGVLPVMRTLPHGGVVWGATWNADESLILTRSYDGKVKVWEAGSETPRETLLHGGDRVYGATWNGDESLILTWGWDGTAKVWEAGSETPRETLLHGYDRVNGATWNADESLILTWGDDFFSGTSTAKVWEAGSETPRETLFHDGPVNGATWNGDESLILTWSEDWTAKVWEAGSETPRETLPHGRDVWGATWNGDESLILTWGDDFFSGTATAKVWEAGSETPRETLPHGGWVNGATWNGDESLILTWSNDGTARVWEAGSGRELARLEPDGTEITSARWNATETHILLTTAGGLAVVYPLAWDELERVACRRLPWNIELGDWTRFFPGRPYRCSCANLPPHRTVLAAPNVTIDADSCPLLP